MSGASASVPSVVAAAGLVGGFFVARRTGRRGLGGALLAAAGLGAVYVAAMGGSHPSARYIGAWPSVAAVTAVTVAAAEVVTRTTGR